MPFSVIAAVLFGAALHAGWNTVLKGAANHHLETAALLLGAALIALVSLPFLPPIAPAAYPWVASSALLHILYFSLLASAYRSGDLGHAYPLMRGTPPLLLALTAPLYGEHLSWARWGAILIISLGILGFACPNRTASLSRLTHGRTTRLALLNALVIAAYTLNDGLGARRSASPFAYTLATFLFTALPYLPLHAGLTWSRWRLHLHPPRLGLGLIAGGMSVASYGLALWAMGHAPIAPVAALRESAILFGLVFARIFLAEPIGWQRGLCGALIFGGVCLLRLV